MSGIKCPMLNIDSNTSPPKSSHADFPPLCTRFLCIILLPPNQVSPAGSGRIRRHQTEQRRWRHGKQRGRDRKVRQNFYCVLRTSLTRLTCTCPLRIPQHPLERPQLSYSAKALYCIHCNHAILGQFGTIHVWLVHCLFRATNVPHLTQQSCSHQ
jgi:hypothetical protein